MLPSFVIGLREGLEAALIVGIVAAFLRQRGRGDLLRLALIGVAAAVLLCIGVGVGLEVLSKDLPQRQQEGLETVVGFIAVGMVTYMVVWMKRHSRDLKGQLEGAASDAIASGSGMALVVMAFLAVLREGFETVVFLLAAFDASHSAAAAGFGAALGILVAVILGYGIYRGGVRINLSKFFRATGLVLVVVAAGLVATALHTAHEAGWLNGGQQATVDLTSVMRPGTVQYSLLSGILGIQQRPVLIEVIGWALYLLPLGLYVGWPAGRSIPRRTGRLVATAVGVGCAIAAIVVLPSGKAASAAGASVRAGGSQLSSSSAGSSAALLSDPSHTLVASGQVRGALAATEVHDGLVSQRFEATASVAADPSLPKTATAAETAALNSGRLPLGAAGSNGVLPASATLTYATQSQLTWWVEPRTGVVLDYQQLRSTVITAQFAGNPESFVLSTPRQTQTSAQPQAVSAASSDVRAALSASTSRHDRREWALALAVLAIAAAAVALGWRAPTRPTSTLAASTGLPETAGVAIEQEHSKRGLPSAVGKR